MRYPGSLERGGWEWDWVFVTDVPTKAMCDGIGWTTPSAWKPSKSKLAERLIGGCWD